MTDAPAHRQGAFTEALRRFIRNYADFERRSSRGAFGWSFLVIMLALTATAGLDAALFGGGRGGVFVLSTLAALAVLIPFVAVGMRRLHDIDKSGWWLLFGFVPAAGWVILLVLFCLPGTRGANRFGPDVEAGRAGV